LPVIFCEHFGENHLILLQTDAKWRCITFRAIFTLYNISEAIFLSNIIKLG